jgi:hypothetical protein
MKWALPTPRRCAGDLGTSRDFWQQLIRKISGNMFFYRKEYVCNEKGWFFYKKMSCTCWFAPVVPETRTEKMETVIVLEYNMAH